MSTSLSVRNNHVSRNDSNEWHTASFSLQLTQKRRHSPRLAAALHKDGASIDQQEGCLFSSTSPKASPSASPSASP
eukprot:scaffold298381_cov23-Tisochrysis_lutea.AAC.1